MFTLINEFLNNLSSDSKISASSLKYVSFDNKLVYVENFDEVLLFNEEEILLKTNNNRLKIHGRNLFVKELSKKYICISGIIKKIDME